MKKRILLQVVAVAAAIFSIPAIALAAQDSDFTQQINEGTLSTDILDASKVPVSNPAVTMDSKAFSFDCQTSTKAFGTASERIYVSDGLTTNTNGWNLSVAATGGVTSTWSDGSNDFDYNDPGTTGCADSAADTDSIGGQMTINPGTVNSDCTGCTTTGISAGTTDSFDEGDAPNGTNVTLMNAGGTAQNIWRGYLTGASVEQKIPGGQTPGNYSLNLTLTVVQN
jgi:hypothetical protein